MEGESISTNTTSEAFPSIVELNVGGQLYTTALSTLIKVTDSLLGQIFSGHNPTAIVRDTRGRYFLDRDGVLFRYVLDYLRNMRLVLPESFDEKERLKQEAEYYNLVGLVKCINNDKLISSSTGTSNNASSSVPYPIAPKLSPVSVYNTSNHSNSHSPHLQSHLSDFDQRFGHVTIGYRGTFAFGRDGLADVKFRKLNRILICGRVSLCREIFKDTLNESRDPDRGHTDRYTSRYFLKHTFLEQAFDMLAQAHFRVVGCCASSTSNIPGTTGAENDEARWNHYNEFVFFRGPSYIS